MSDHAHPPGRGAGHSDEVERVRATLSAAGLDGITADWNRDLTAFDYVEYCLEVHSQSRTSLVFIEVLEGVPDWSRVQEDVERATRIVLRMRQRVVTPVLPVAAARWVTDPDFDPAYHLRRVSLPGPGSLDQLLDLVRTIAAAPLDLNRPLWEATLVEGLRIDDGAAAIVWKLSQPVIDGLAGILLDQVMHADVPNPDRGSMPPIPVPEDLSPADLTRAALRKLPITAGRGLNQRSGDTVRLIAASARDPARAVRTLVRAARSLRGGGAGPVGEPSPLLRRRGLSRRFATTDVELADLRGAARAHGCSVQDAILAAVCGGIRLYHEQLGVPVSTLPLAMPLGIHSGDETTGDLWTGLRMAAPIAEVDAAERMRQVRQILLTTRAEPGFAVLRSAAPIVPWLPVQVFGALGQPERGIDVHVSTVAGQAGQVFLAGERVTRAIPLGPLLGGAATIVSCSMSGHIYLGVSLDLVAVSDPETFMACLNGGFAEVIALAANAPEPAPAVRKLTRVKASPRRASGDTA